MPGATVVATQIQTGARTETVTGADGQYTLPFLLPGTYRISAEAAGFKRYVRDGISISANERLAIDIPLEIGADGRERHRHRRRAAAGNRHRLRRAGDHPTQVENIPMNGRTPLMLAQLWAGVIPQGGPLLTRPFDSATPRTSPWAARPARTTNC